MPRGVRNSGAANPEAETTEGIGLEEGTDTTVPTTASEDTAPPAAPETPPAPPAAPQEPPAPPSGPGKKKIKNESCKGLTVYAVSGKPVVFNDEGVAECGMDDYNQFKRVPGYEDVE